MATKASEGQKLLSPPKPSVGTTDINRQQDEPGQQDQPGEHDQQDQQDRPGEQDQPGEHDQQDQQDQPGEHDQTGKRDAVGEYDVTAQIIDTKEYARRLDINVKTAAAMVQRGEVAGVLCRRPLRIYWPAVIASTMPGQGGGPRRGRR